LGFDAPCLACAAAEAQAGGINGFYSASAADGTTSHKANTKAAAHTYMNPPSTYAEWAACCDQLLKGDSDEDSLAAMQAGQLEWTSGVAERITRRVHEVFDSRLKSLGEKFQRDVNHARGHETLLANALLDIRKRLLPVARLASMPAWPDMVKQSLQQSLQQFVERTQNSLESSARNDRTGRMLDIVRRNRVCVPEVPVFPGTRVPSSLPETGTAGGAKPPRRILLP
jgi:hypothetical protein